MRIGLGITRIQAPTGTGAAQRALLHGLGQVGGDHEFVVFGTATDLTAVPAVSHFNLREVPNSEHVRTTVAGEGLDLFHGLSYLIPLGGTCRTIVTVPDTMLLRNVDGLPRLRDTQTMISRCARTADRVITVSKYARRRISEELGLLPQRVDVVYNGISHEFHPGLGVHRAPQPSNGFDLPGRYALYVGGISPRKNLETLLAAFDLVWRECPEPIFLVIVNGMADGGLHPVLRKALVDHQVTDAGWLQGSTHEDAPVVVTAALGTDELASLYRAAALLCYPSLEEGFGLPPVEAMACGTPVVASNASCLPEILGDAALLVDPADARGFGRAMLRLLGDGPLAARVRVRGLARARRYSAEATATRALEVYTKAQTASM